MLVVVEGAGLWWRELDCGGGSWIVVEGAGLWWSVLRYQHIKFFIGQFSSHTQLDSIVSSATRRYKNHKRVVSLYGIEIYINFNFDFLDLHKVFF